MQSTKMQGDSLQNEYEIFKNRIVYCLCDLHAKQKGKGLNFDELLKSYQISFCNFVMFDNNDLINKFNMRNQSGLKLSDSVTAVSIEVPKLGDVLAKPITEMSAIEIWTMFFAHADNPQFKAKIGETMRVKEEIAMATEILNTISKDEHAIAKYRARRKWEADLTTNLSVSRRLGREEGIIIGRQECMQEIIEKFRRGGMSENEIEKFLQ